MRNILMLVLLAVFTAGCSDTITNPVEELPPVAKSCEIWSSDCDEGWEMGNGPGNVTVDFTMWRFLLTMEQVPHVRAMFEGQEMARGRLVYFSSPSGQFASCSSGVGGRGVVIAGCEATGATVRCGYEFDVDVRYAYVDDSGYVKWTTVRQRVKMC